MLTIVWHFNASLGAVDSNLLGVCGTILPTKHSERIIQTLLYRKTLQSRHPTYTVRRQLPSRIIDAHIARSWTIFHTLFDSNYAKIRRIIKRWAYYHIDTSGYIGVKDIRWTVVCLCLTTYSTMLYVVYEVCCSCLRLIKMLMYHVALECMSFALVLVSCGTLCNVCIFRWCCYSLTQYINYAFSNSMTALCCRDPNYITARLVRHSNITTHIILIHLMFGSTRAVAF